MPNVNRLLLCLFLCIGSSAYADTASESSPDAVGAKAASLDIAAAVPASSDLEDAFLPQALSSKALSKPQNSPSFALVASPLSFNAQTQAIRAPPLS